MCGIAGVFQYRDDLDLRGCADALGNALAHRGPDDAGVMNDAAHRCLLVHRRLSIIDPTDAGHQPMQDASGRYVIVLNGEIYNYEELRRELKTAGCHFVSNTDTEVLLYAYRYWGRDCLARLRGMFAFVIFDRGPQGPSLFLARDRFGIKPLLYARNKNGFIFGSEAQPLVTSGLVAPKISETALGQYLATGSVQPPDTIYQEVFQLLPGHCLTVTADQAVSIQRWYDVRTEAFALSSTYEGVDAQGLVELTAQRLEEAARYHLVSDVEVGALLSGGVDSAAVVAWMKKFQDVPVKTFSIGFESQSEVNDELAAAHSTAQFLETQHCGVIVRNDEVPAAFERFISVLDQPSIDGFNTFLVSEAASRQVKVALCGLGGDELFGGYSYFGDILKAMRWRFSIPLEQWAWSERLPLRLTKIFSYPGMTPYEAVRHFRHYRSLSWMKRATAFSWQPIPCDGDEPRLGSLSRMGLAELDGYLNATLLHDSDQLSMAHSLEVRPVLLDHPLVEHALALPDRVKQKDGRSKAVLVDAVRGLIPPECAARKKSGFELPFRSWLQGPLSKQARNVFFTENARAVFLPGYYQQMARRVSRNEFTRWDWQWFVLLRWLEQQRINL